MERETLEDGSVVLWQKIPLKKSKLLWVKVMMLTTLQYLMPLILPLMMSLVISRITAMKTGFSLEEIEGMELGADMILKLVVVIAIGMAAYHAHRWCAERYAVKFVGALLIGSLILAAWVVIEHAPSAYGMYSALLLDFCVFEGYIYRWYMLFSRRQIQRMTFRDLTKQSTKHFTEEVLPGIEKVLDEIDAEFEAEIAKENLEK